MVDGAVSPLRNARRATTSATAPSPGHAALGTLAACVLALAWAVAPAYGQDPGLGEAWRWSEFYTSSGLPSNRIIEIVETGRGLWASTADGAAWFDGYRWHAVGSTEGLPDGGLQRLTPAGENDEVLAVAHGGLFRGGTDGFQRVPVVQDGIGVHVIDAAATRDGRILAYTSQGLFLVDDGATTPVELPGPDIGTRPRRLTRTRSGSVFYAGSTGVYRWLGDGWQPWIEGRGEPLRLTAVRERPGLPSYAYVAWPLGLKGLWTRTANGAPLHDPETRLTAIRALDMRADGLVLGVSESGEVFTRAGGQWRTQPELPVAQGTVTALHYADSGDLWVGSEGGLYLHRATDDRWSFYRLPPAGEWNRVNEILPAGGDTVWIGTAAGLAVRTPSGRVDTLPRLGDAPFAPVTGLAEDDSGRLWVTSGAHDHLFVGRPGAWRRLGPEDGLEGTNIHRVRRGPDGGLWLLGLTGSGPGGVFRPAGERVQRWEEDADLPGERVYDLAFDGDAMWFATYEGVSRYREGSWRHWPSVTRAFALTVDLDGRAWFADQLSGVGRIDGDSVTEWSSSEGLPSDEVWGLARGPGGDVWAATLGGLARWSSGEWISLGAGIGLPALGLWPLRFVGDRLFIGTLSAGVAVLDLAAAEAHPPRVIFADPVVQGRSVQVAWTPFAYRGELPPPRLSTRSRVDGGPWSVWSDQRSLNAELSPGPHTITVEARGPLGAPRASATTTFSVLPPLAFRPAVYVPVGGLLVLIAILLGMLAARRRRHRAELLESERRYRQFFEQDLTGDCTFDASGTIETCNPAFAAMFGFESPEAARGSSLAELSGDPEWFPGIRSRLETGEHITYEQTRLRRRDQSDILVVYNVIHQESGDPFGRAYFFDDTSRMLLEDQLRQAQKMDAIGRLAGGVAHDFNNLMTVVTGYAELLQRDLDEASPHQEDIDNILVAARRARDVTSKLLAFGRRQILELRPLDLVAVIKSMEPILSKVGEPNVTLEFDHEIGLPLVRSDAIAIGQVVLNLVMNAADATDGGEGTVVVRTRTATLPAGTLDRADTRRDGDWVVLEVEDGGVGIEPELLDRIFEPFFTTKEPGRGTGLGLSMVHGIVHQSGGFIEVDSTRGEGTTFSLYLPIAAGDRSLSVTGRSGVGSRPDLSPHRAD